MLYESIRARQENLINQNPTTITILRITRTRPDDGDGGVLETPSTLLAQTVRIYNKRARVLNIRVLNIDEGGYHIQHIMGMIALYNADVKAESDTYLDKFNYGEKTYKIVDVKDITTQGQVVFKECGLEEIA